jgi:MYXO-CTERM domain-containing protein
VVEFPDDQFGVALLDVRVVPEPSTLTLAGLGLLGLTLVGRRRR